jgi:hypothetical protein
MAEHFPPVNPIERVKNTLTSLSIKPPIEYYRWIILRLQTEKLRKILSSEQLPIERNDIGITNLKDNQTQIVLRHTLENIDQIIAQLKTMVGEIQTVKYGTSSTLVFVSSKDLKDALNS